MAFYFYTCNANGEDAAARGYAPDVTSCLVYSAQHPGTVMLNRWEHPETGGSFLTTDPNGEGIQRIGYQLRLPAQGWVFPPDAHPPEGAVALKEWVNKTRERYYSFLPAGGQRVPDEFKDSTPILKCYVFPGTYPDAIPLYQWARTAPITVRTKWCLWVITTDKTFTSQTGPLTADEVRGELDKFVGEKLAGGYQIIDNYGIPGSCPAYSAKLLTAVAMHKISITNVGATKIQVLIRGAGVQNIEVDAGQTEIGDATPGTPLIIYWRRDGSQCTEEADGGNGANRLVMPDDDLAISLPHPQWLEQTAP